MEHEDIDRIKSKISKLLKLAEGSSNEFEAANAMSKARALMDKYQITKIDIVEVNGIEKEFKEAQATRAFKACPKHIQWLSVYIAKFNDCQAKFITGVPIDFKKNDKRVYNYGKAIIFRGYSLDVDICIEMFTRAISAVNRLCAIYLENEGYEGRYPMGIGNAFKQGCVSRIGEILNGIKVERGRLTTSSGTSLVVLKENSVAAYFGEAKYGTSRGTERDYESEKAYLHGELAGNSVELQSKIETEEE